MTTIRRKQQSHGLIVNGKKHPIYKLRERMIRYCYTAKNGSNPYKYYRSKGIIVYDGWINDIKSFYNWCIDNGWQKGLSIDRIDSNGNYEPNNCRFITKSENSKKARLENNQSGINSSNVILNEEKIIIIKYLLKLNFRVCDIAKLFKVASNTISGIKNNNSWKHVKELKCQLCRA